MDKLVTIYGGSGFVGRYIARRMAQQGWRVRIAVRRPNEALFTKAYGVVGQVEPVLCNIRDDASVRQAARGADAVVNCVGTFDRGGKNNFDAIHVAGAERIARIATEEGVANLVQISGLIDGGESLYAQSKAAGEAAVLAAFPSASILRPSVIFGTEDKFFNRFAAMAQCSLIVPLVGAQAQFQPVYVDDVAQAAQKILTGEAAGGIYELGGPDVGSLRSFVERMLPIIHRRRAVIALPNFVAKIMACSLDTASALTGRLIRNTVLTSDQVISLRSASVVATDAKGFADLGMRPADIESVLPEYLWRFRPSGQYKAIKDSAKNLRRVQS